MVRVLLRKNSSQPDSLLHGPVGLGWGSIINHNKRSHLTFQSQTDKSICSFVLFLAKPSASLVKLILCACLVTCPVQLFVTLWTVTKKAPLSMKFPRQESWSGLPCPPPGSLPDPGIEPESPELPALQIDSLPLSHWGSSYMFIRSDQSSVMSDSL